MLPTFLLTSVSLNVQTNETLHPLWLCHEFRVLAYSSKTLFNRLHSRFESGPAV